MCTLKPWRLLTLLIGITSTPGIAREVTFDDLNLGDNSSWVGPDESGTDVPGAFDTTVRVGQFESNGVVFHNQFNLDWQSWSGMAYSSKTDNTTPGYTNDVSAITGSGYDDAIYAISFGYVDGLDPLNLEQLGSLPNFELPEGERIVDMQVTNTTYAALSMRDGDSFAKQFGGATGTDPDYFRLTAFGVDESGALTGQSEIYLADFQSQASDDDYILDEWATFDLTALHDARRVYFNLESTDVGQFGVNTPTYFAFDNIRTMVDSTIDSGDWDGDGELTVVDLDDLLAATRHTDADLRYDLSEDGTVDGDDIEIWVRDLKSTYFGDADLDGQFGSSDLVNVFDAGQYEDDIQLNSTWATGDWDGDGDFTSRDIILAFKDGGYDQGPRAGNASTVPEPTSSMGLALAASLIALFRRRAK